MDGYTIGWLGWGLYFVMLETVAIVKSYRQKRRIGPYKDGTLSAHVWVWFGTDKTTHANTWAYLRRFALIAFMAWLSVHFIGGGQLV